MRENEKRKHGQLFHRIILKNIHIKIPGIHKYVTLHGKRTVQIWLRALRLGGYPELFGWTKYSLIGSKKCNKNADAEVSHTVWKGFPSPLLALKMEEGGHEPKNADSRTGKRQGNTIFLYPLQPPEWNTVPKPFTFAQWVYIRLVTYKTVR